MRYLSSVLMSFRPAFSRNASFVWFIVIIIGFISRTDHYGVSSIMRTLSLPPSAYFSLLHFFHSTAFTVTSLLSLWQRQVLDSKSALTVNGRHVILGDHTNSVKDARKMPGVRTIRQNSETASKPSYFRGHRWACLGLLCQTLKRHVLLPLMIEFHPSDSQESMAVRPISKALEITNLFSIKAYVVLDAFFAVGPVFLKAMESQEKVHIVTRAKSNIVAYHEPQKTEKRKRGRPKMYGKKVRLHDSFKDKKDKFKKTKATVYGKMETVDYLVLDLIWRPVKKTIRFFCVSSSRGNIVIMTTDMSMKIKEACLLYCRRIAIETFFDVLKNLLGGMGYHFWSRFLNPISRSPKKNKEEPASSKPEKTAKTLSAIEKFMSLQMIAVGIVMLLSIKRPKEISRQANCWQRTSSLPDYPSAFVVVSVIRKNVKGILEGFGKKGILGFILRTRKNSGIQAVSGKAA